MKIWYQHGSEHSANLVMIGHFEDSAKAAKSKETIDELTKRVTEDHDNGEIVLGSPSERYGRKMLDLLGRLNVNSIGPRELEQFLYDVRVEIEGSKIILTTDEIEVSAFLKVMFDNGARIEVFSAHTHSDIEYRRGR